MNLKLRIKKINQKPVLEITGGITGENVGKITSKLDSLRKSEHGVIGVDLRRTTFIDSHGLGAFVFISRILKNQQRELVFIEPHNFIRNMFTGSNLDKIFRIVESDEDL